ncbi:hypothetical protein LZC95_39725 [Pendulispora brunnea]|uniref:Uncharacterized protein n=1 Tax=Pendulispora brunnea TaxID=2905690 RepID=A0ABZ2K1H5_9BACT
MGTLAVAPLTSKAAYAGEAEEGILVVATHAKNVVIEGRDTDNVWQPLCTSPCSTVVTPDTLLRARLGTIVAMYAIVGRAGDRVELPIADVKARAHAREIGRGVAMTGGVVGVAALLTSLGLLMAATFHETCLNLYRACADEAERAKESDQFRDQATVSFLAGAAVLAISALSLVLMNEISTTGQVVKAAQRPVKPAAVWRVPAPSVIRTPPATDLPRATIAPLFRVTF